jgi:hypothetical protein
VQTGEVAEAEVVLWYFHRASSQGMSLFFVTFWGSIPIGSELTK